VFYKIGSVEAALFMLALLPGIIGLIAGQKSTAETADIAKSSIARTSRELSIAASAKPMRIPPIQSMDLTTVSFNSGTFERVPRSQKEIHETVLCARQDSCNLV